MKRFLALSLITVFAVSAALTGCNNEDNKTMNSSVKFGAGVYISSPSVTDATEDKNGSGKLDVTVAAVTVDEEGRVVSCDVDTASNTVGFTFDGKGVAADEFKTKHEIGADYNMVAYGGAIKEWFEQADSFEALVRGKTLDEIKALVADNNKGKEEVINAGCTIMINEFVAAIEKAYASLSQEVKADAAAYVSIATAQTCSDADEERDGSNKLSVNTFASAKDGDGKVLAATSDCVELAFTFDVNGVSTLDTSKEILSKREQGEGYGMVAYGGATREWFEQAAAFDGACVGKTSDEIASLVTGDGKGVQEVQSAGCTIDATGFVMAASKN